MKGQGLRYVTDFDWTDDEQLVVQPVHPVAVYTTAGGIAVRQRRVSEHCEDQVVFIPQESIGALIERLDTLHYGDGIIDATCRNGDRVVPIHLPE